MSDWGSHSTWPGVTAVVDVCAGVIFCMLIMPCSCEGSCFQNDARGATVHAVASTAQLHGGAGLNAGDAGKAPSPPGILLMTGTLFMNALPSADRELVKSVGS